MRPRSGARSCAPRTSGRSSVPTHSRRERSAAKFNAQASFRGNIMTLRRREFLHRAAGAAALLAMPTIAVAQSYPTRPVHIIVGVAAGGPNDTVARLIGQWLSERLGQQFVVENRTGAGGNIATEAVVRSPADGYTLLLETSANAVNVTLYD